MTDILERLKNALSDRYAVEREVGQGGMATVYLAEDLKHRRKVAIKVLLPDLAASVGHDRFLQEIEIAAKLQHPHILPVYDSGEAGGLLYYVMPFVEGESLRDLIIRQGGLESDQALSIAREVAGALDFAHRSGVVHRDIKPANILISDGHAVVADFGIARAISVSGGQGLTQVGMAIGTPSYMSPEQALGDTELDGRTDVYALGSVLYEMMSGNPPFEGTSPQAIVAKTISAEVPKLERDPIGVQPVIERAMAKEPGDRFQTAGEMEKALRVGSTSLSGPMVAPRRRNYLAIGIAAVALVVIAVLAWPRGWSVEGDPRQSIIVFPFENKTADADKDYWEDASMNLLGLAIAQWEDMRVYDDERTSSLLRRSDIGTAADLDFDAAQAMAKEARVGTLVLGDIRRQGDSLAIEAKVHDVATGDRLATEIIRTGRDADPRMVFDSLAGLVLHVSGAPPGERPDLVAQTTNSLEAYRAYLRGTEALQQFDVDEARAAFTEAIELDSTFALAYLRLRDADGWAGLQAQPEKRRDWTAKAQTHSGNLPPRIRTLVQFYVAYESGEMVRARELANQLIAKDSSDVEAWYQLGEAHFHDNPGSIPRQPEYGNMGMALRAFDRVLQLEPRYLLAYQHLIDVLGNCSRNNPWLCLADSAVYGPRDSLDVWYGADEVARIMAEQRARRIDAAYAWVDAAPQSGHARSNLVQLLMNEERPAEARAQLNALRATGAGTEAAVWEGRLLLREEQYAAAADTFEAVLDDPAIMRILLTGNGPEVAFDALASGGRLARVEAFFLEIMEVVAGMSNERTRALAPWWLDAMERLYGDDSTTYQRALSATGYTLLQAYVTTRDTTILSRYLARIDTAGSRTWRTMDAHLAWARGDTAQARMRVEAQVENADDLEFAGEFGGPRAWAWADLLAEMGDPAGAIAVYGWFDSTSTRMSHPTLQVRSWAERGALYQQLGERDRAIEMYQKFIDAWAGGDDIVQPQVQAARDAIAALSGEVDTPED
jgi:serine/threonine-protein kinase